MDDDGFTTVHVNKDSYAVRESVDDEGFQTVHARTSEAGPKKTGADKDSKYLDPDLGTAKNHYLQQLPHRVIDARQPSGYRLCLPGETRGTDGEVAQLYGLCADADQIFEFGLGVALYFRTLKLMFIVFFVLAVLSTLAMDTNKEYNPPGTPSTLEGSAYGAVPDSLRISGQGAFSLIVTGLLVLVLVVSGVFQKRTAHKIDKNFLTPADYSVVVENPPRNVSDPLEYHKFFSKFGDVVLVTIALNNGELVTSLKDKKVFEAQVASQKRYKELAKAHGKFYRDTEHLPPLQKMLQRYGLYPTLGYAEQRLWEAEKVVFGNSQKDYFPWRVYVTFSQQKGAVSCLSRTNLSYYQIITGNAGGSDALYNNCLLNISKAPEPTDIIFENSHYTQATRWFYTLISYALCGGVMAAVFEVVVALAKQSSSAVAVFISCMNAVLPTVALYSTFLIEKHVKRSDMEMSTLLKLVVVRCINSGVFIYLTVDKADRFGEKHLNHIVSILIADAVTTPVFRFLDLGGMFNRLVLSRGVATQEEMNVLFTPTDWTLAERYTDMLKTIFVGTFFAVPVPAGLIITCCAMFTIFWVDKYSLLRLWKRPPALDDSLATTSRFFFCLIVFAHIAVTKDYFARWAYTPEVLLNESCSLLSCKTGSYMTDAQKQLVTIYNALTVTYFTLSILVLGVIYGGGKLLSLFSENAAFAGIGSVLDVESDVSFRELESQSAYVPVLEPAEVADPIIFSDISNLPSKFLPLHRSSEFSDEVDPTSYSIVSKEELSHVDEHVLKSLFSKVVYFEVQGSNFVPYQRPKFIGSQRFAVRSQQEDIAAAAATGSSSSSVSPNTSQQQPPAVVAPLPAEWEERQAPDGRTYYANKVNKTTQWNRPS